MPINSTLRIIFPSEIELSFLIKIISLGKDFWFQKTAQTVIIENFNDDYINQNYQHNLTFLNI